MHFFVFKLQHCVILCFIFSSFPAHYIRLANIVSAAMFEENVNTDEEALTSDVTTDEDIVRESQKEHMNKIDTDGKQDANPKTQNINFCKRSNGGLKNYVTIHNAAGKCVPRTK